MYTYVGSLKSGRDFLVVITYHTCFRSYIISCVCGFIIIIIVIVTGVVVMVCEPRPFEIILWLMHTSRILISFSIM